MKHIVYIAFLIFFGVTSLISFGLGFYLTNILFVAIGALLAVDTALVSWKIRKTKNNSFFITSKNPKPFLQRFFGSTEHQVEFTNLPLYTENDMKTQLHRGRLIDHIQLVVRDLKASQEFYTAVLAVLDIPIIGTTESYFWAGAMPPQSSDYPRGNHACNYGQRKPG